MNNVKKAGLYIHVPFCLKKCNYCDFYSLSADESLRGRYTSALISQLREKATLYKERIIDTVYIGGGTPTFLGSGNLCRIVNEVYDSFNVISGAEFTVETNPGISSENELTALFRAGVNRLSIGLQSANADELELLGRIHTLEDYENTLKNARTAGFVNISTDIMFSLPSQGKDKLEKTLDFVISHAPKHISAYSLKIEPGTPFYKAKDTFILPDDDTDADMYLLICDRLKAAGYNHYEISNFARAGYESRHNLRYWESKEYIGFGPSAHSYIDSVRYAYSKSITDFLAVYESGSLNEADIVCERKAIDRSESAMEKLMLSLRLSSGVKDSVLEEFASIDVIYKKIKPLVEGGLINILSDGFALTDNGMYVSNAVIGFISEISD
ncbi:MAG: radical SAM family heme chaperone HemW [Ruminococcaceae bacterium]|nr:radical SAM family heme chaperone HemW [Oscillospiraceae bacterium]